ncbi:MAG: hypothetical protein FH751_16445 [Firmicutes bacterium]|nr:hypothetical protein [Bacillota bacterium]
MKKQQELFPILSNKALDFARGQTQGDIEKLNKVVSNNIIIIEKDNEIYGKYESYGEKIKYMLFNKNSKIKYKDMLIQGYRYNEENNTYLMHIREFYVDENNNPVSPPTFLNLYFSKIEGVWKVVKFNFDV